MDEKFREVKQRGTLLSPIQLYRMANRGAPLFVSYHWHPEIEILFIQKGTLSILVKGESFTGTPGDVFWINPEELHGMSAGCEPVSYGALVFPMEFLNFERYDYTQSHYLNPLCRKEKYFSTKVPRQSRHYAQIWEELTQIDTLDREQAPCRNIAVKASLFKLVSLMIQDDLLHSAAGPGGEKRDPDAKSALLKSVLSYLDQHCGEKLSLKQVAGNFNFSAKYFSHFFKENLNRNMMEYLNRMRIEKAAERLTGSNLPIGEIALEAGFDNFSYFIRQFKRVYGCTPTCYRRQTKGRAPS